MSKQSAAFKSDPSMDEILASIRSMISEDVQSTQTPGQGQSAPKQQKKSAVNSATDSKSEVLELTQVVNDDGTIENLEREEPKMAKKDTENTEEALELETPAEESMEAAMEVSADAPADVDAAPDADEGESLISDEAFSESMSALSGLDCISEETLNKVGKGFDGSKTLEVLMADIMRPMLKQWIGANLPSLVKVIVSEQVEKVMQARFDTANTDATSTSANDSDAAITEDLAEADEAANG